MRKTLAQCCFALLMAPVLVCILLGTVALAASSGGSGTGTGSTDTSTNDGPSRVTDLILELEGDDDKFDTTGGKNTVELKYNEQTQLNVTVTARWTGGANDRDVTLTSTQASIAWISSNKNVVDVPSTRNGRIVATGKGTATVTLSVTYEGVTRTAEVEVTVTSLTRVIIQEYSANVREVYAQVGEQKELSALVTVDDEVKHNYPVVWTSSDPAVVAGGHTGAVFKFTPAGKGNVTITATYNGEKETVVCIVTEKSDPDDPGGDDDNNDPGGQLPTGVSVASLSIDTPTSQAGSPHVMDPGSENIKMTVTFNAPGDNGATLVVSGRVDWSSRGEATAVYPANRMSYEIPITFTSTDREVATVVNGRLTAAKAGLASITASAGGVTSSPLEVEVSGFQLTESSIEVEENKRVDLPIEFYGNASINSLKIWSNNTNIARVEDGQVAGYTPGTTTVTISSGASQSKIEVEVVADSSATIEAGKIKTSGTLKFSDLISEISRQAGGALSHITGLNVDPGKGTLYYNYKSETLPGKGVGAENYYLNPPTAGQRAIKDITFVPNRSFSGGQVTISYSAVSTGNRNYACKIILTVEPETGSSAVISLETDYNTPIRFTGTEFSRVCRERLNARLSYVTFSQPPERQGTLYTNYSASGNYGGVVDMRRQYTEKELDDIWFVPAPGYSGPVTIYYTAYGAGVNGGSYAGQVTINVGREGGVAIGGLAYDIAKGGVAHLDDEDFNDYCQEILDRGQDLSFIRFDSLPAESQGVLYYDYRSATNTGNRAAAGISYYYGIRNPRIDRLAFVPAADFTGTLKLPFTGWTADGTSFSGNVEINVRSGTGSGDIYYTCAPGRSVSFRSSDFTSLSQTLTGRTIDYIVFRDLPGSGDGSLYYGSSRINTTGTQYRSTNISRLSFRAGSSFSGTVDIPFEGRAANGATFYGVITIGTSGSGSSGSRENIRYYADEKSPAVFNRSDFDSLSQWETDQNINSVRFTLPSGSQGTLYRNYRSTSSQGTRITSNTSITASDLDRVAFVPASGYTGTAYIDFTATAAGSGGTFTGTVEVEVALPPADVTARYSTRTQPVRFYASDLARSGSTLSSIQLNALPSAGEGYLYYQYSSPTRYGRQAGTGTAYRASGSNLISDLAFVPRAGFTGTVTIPYTGTNSNNSTFTGEIVITVSPTYSSSYFSDMGSYSSAQQAAVDFLYDHNITRGLTTGQYGPENSIRRGDFARMLYQAFELSPTGTSGAFVDVSSGAYYAEAVNTLYARGIVSGIGNGCYAPDSTLTRQDAVCMVQRAMRSMGWSANDGSENALYAYSDGGSVSGYAKGAMSLAVQRGYLPTSGGWLNPTQALTRVDMAEILHRVLTY